VARGPVSRRVALLVAAAAVALLALGWVADALGQLGPAAPVAKDQTQQAGLYRVSLAFDPSPPAAGMTERLTLHVTDTSGRDVSDARVRLGLSMPAMVIAPLQVSAAWAGGGEYRAEGAFPMRGGWVVTVEIAPARGDAVHTDFNVAVR
jgi:hypothetical protein